MAYLFELKNGKVGYSNKSVLEDINFEVKSGEVLCILGANGVGKSTLFKSMLGFIPMIDGSVNIDGENINTWERSKVARYIGYIPQATELPFSFTVMDIVLMGRTAHLGLFVSPKKKDEEIAYSIISKLGITKLINKKFSELSGGERQLVLIARALTQLPKILIMDEPTAALDFGNQQLVLEQVNLLSKQGLSVIMASHFPDHAFIYSHKVLMLKGGNVYAFGKPKDVITEDSLRELYSVNTKIINTGIQSISTGNNILTCIPLN